MSLNLTYTLDNIVTLISNGRDTAADIAPALEDAFKNRIDINTPMINIALGASAMSIEFLDDDKVKITTTTRAGMSSMHRFTQLPEVEMVFDVTEDGQYSLSKMRHKEIWDGDISHFKSWLAVSEVDLESGGYKTNVINLAEYSGFIEMTNQFLASNAEARHERYEKHAAIADRIEAATSPDDIADIVAEHAEKLKVRQDALDVIEELKLEKTPEAKALVQAFEDVESSVINADYDRSLVVSKVLGKVQDAEGFQMAAAIYRNHFVHKSDRDAKSQVHSIPDRSSELYGLQKDRANKFGQYFESNPHGAIVKHLADTGNSLTDGLAFALQIVTKHIGNMGKYWVHTSDSFEDGLKSLENTQALMGIFSDAIDKGELIDVLTWKGDPETPAAALQNILARVDILNPKGSIVLSPLCAMAEKTRKERLDALKGNYEPVAS